MKLKKTIFIKLSFSFLCAFTIDISAEDVHLRTTMDGRLDTKCPAWTLDQTKQFCVVPFERLLATPERYNGKYVRLIGFIVKSFDNVVLYPSPERYHANAMEEGLELLGNFKLPSEINSGIVNGVYPVVVIGLFDANYQGGRFLRLGALRDIHKVDVMVTLQQH